MATLDAFPAAEREAFTNACRRHGFIAADFSVCDMTGEQDRLVSVLRPETPWRFLDGRNGGWCLDGLWLPKAAHLRRKLRRDAGKGVGVNLGKGRYLDETAVRMSALSRGPLVCRWPDSDVLLPWDRVADSGCA